MNELLEMLNKSNAIQKKIREELFNAPTTEAAFRHSGIPDKPPICSILVKTNFGFNYLDIGPGYLSVDDAVKLIKALNETPTPQKDA
jgi:hypothetical protein